MQFPIRDFRAGQIVIAEGTSGDMIYIVKSGTLEVSKQVKDKKIILGQLGEGEIVGEMSIFTPGQVRLATVRALVSSELVELRAEDFKTLLEQSPNIITAVMKAVIRRLRNTTLNLSARPTDAPFISVLAVLGMLLGRRCKQPVDTPCPYCREQSVIPINEGYRTLSDVLGLCRDEIDFYIDRAVSLHLIKRGEHNLRIQDPENIEKILTGERNLPEPESCAFKQEPLFISPPELAKELGVPLTTIMERLYLVEPEAIMIKRDYTENLINRLNELKRP